MLVAWARAVAARWGGMDRIKMRDAGGGPGLWGGQAVPSSADKEAKMNSVGCLFLQEELFQDVLA